MSSGQSKRNRDQTSPTGSTPYNEYKKSAVETERVDCPAARKALFQQWTKGEEKLLVSFVALHCLDLDSAWPKYKIVIHCGKRPQNSFLCNLMVFFTAQVGCGSN